MIETQAEFPHADPFHIRRDPSDERQWRTSLSKDSQDFIDEIRASHEERLKAQQKPARNERYKLRDVAGRLVGGRVCKCGKKRVSPMVEIWKQEGRAAFQGLETCGSIWACPVCAGKIAVQRAADVTALVQAHELAMYGDQHEGACVHMATLTVSHGPWDTPDALKGAVARSWQAVQQGREWGELKAEYGVLGTVRALEVTHGQSGWHPHLHILFFTEPLADERAQALAETLFLRWQKIISLEMMPPLARYIAKKTLATRSPDFADARRAVIEGFQVYCNAAAQDFRPVFGATGAAEYVAKWGAGCEVGKGEAKRGRKGSRSPWQLLRDYKNGDRQAGALFTVYAAAFKGARHLTYSRGIREMYGLRDLEDAEIAAQSEMNFADESLETPHCVAKIHKGAWFECVAKNIRHDLLIAAEIDGQEGVEALLKKHGIENTTDRRVPPDRPWMPFARSSREKSKRAAEDYHRAHPDILEKLGQTESRRSCHEKGAF